MKTPISLIWICVLLSNPLMRGQDSNPRKSEASAAPATKMEAYNVDETVSPKTHTLFMGADIDLNLDRDLYRVHDVVGSNWVVQISGRDHVVSSKSAPEHLKITPSLKLTEASVTIVGFVKAQAYSFENDPSVRLTRSLSHSAAMSSDLQSVGNDAQARADTTGNHALGGASWFAASDDQFSANALLTSAEFVYAGGRTSTSTSGTLLLPDVTSAMLLQHPASYMFNNPIVDLNRGLADQSARAAAVQTENGDEATGKIVTEGLDAMDIQFGIRSAKPLHNPYVVTMTRFHAPGAKPGLVQNMVYAKSLNPIDQHILRVHLVEEGFPYGFEVVDFQLHIYDRGVELATNISADRVELTHDEAFEYVKMEYLGVHAKDTLAPSVAMGKLPPELRAKVEGGKYAQTYYVKVSRDGFADGAYSDPACKQEVGDIFLDSVIKALRFKPAVDHGKAVDGIALVNLAKLSV
ncbi:MAG TPA: hypothetical protein VFE25_16555 [Opitutaceae bacterium]|jgi:hypothetical protein|nr:hypothetical protein [Opitutaceae bacterium]